MSDELKNNLRNNIQRHFDNLEAVIDEMINENIKNLDNNDDQTDYDGSESGRIVHFEIKEITKIKQDYKNDQNTDDFYPTITIRPIYESLDSDDDDESTLCNSDDEQEVDNIPSHPNGNYQCPLCPRRYLSEYLLGSHFIISHSEYDRMLELDEINTKIGFPGFELLEYIGMVELLTKREIDELIDKKYECAICRETFKHPEPIYVPDNITVESTLSDSALDYIKSYNYNFVKEEILIDTINKFRLSFRVPIKLTCCKNYLCKFCFEFALKRGQSLTCCFCTCDHTKYDLDYIKIYKVGKFDKEAWKVWWLRNDRYINILI